MLDKKILPELGNRIMQKLFGVKAGWYKELDIVQNNYRLGVANLEAGRFSDAAFRLNFLTWLDPKHKEGWFQLARAQIGLDKKPAAIKALKKHLEIAPEHGEAKKLLGVALGKIAPDKMLEIAPETDAAVLYSLHKESFPIYWKEKEISDMLMAAGTQAWVAQLDKAVGMLMMRAQFEQAEILTIAVSPSYRKRKVAAMLLQEAEKELAKTGVKKIFLEVAEDNTAARGLYLKLGYDETNRRKNYYKQADNSFVDALVMSKELRV